MRHLLLLVGLLAIPAIACISHPHTQPQPGEPLTVVIDTGKTMTAKGGEGVGVFVEYRAGGHWHVWWTCDTALSGLSCDFQVSATGTGIANGSAQAQTHTTMEVEVLDFDATPGADVKIDLDVSGLRDGNFFFFVQDGAIDGNYQGNLTDPLIFEPSTP